MSTTDNILIPTPCQEEIKQQFPYMEKIIQASRTINMWPKSKKNNSFTYHFGVFLIIVTSAGYILLSSIKITLDNKDLESVGFLIAPLICTVVTIFRYIYVYVKGDQFQLVVSEIHNNFIHYALFPVEKKRTSIMKHYKIANKLILMYSIFTLLWLLQLCGIPLFVYAAKNINFQEGLNETRLELIPYPVSMKVYAPFDYNKQPANALFFAYIFIVFLIIVWILLLADIFWYMVIFLTIGQFDLLKESINTITEVMRKWEEKDENQLLKKHEIQQVKEAVHHCIRHHQFLRKFIHLMDELYNSQILADTFYNVVTLCFVLLDTTEALRSRDWYRILHSVEFIMSLTVHIFTYNWLANELIVKEEELAEAVYDIPWYKCPDEKQLFLQMLIQTRRPIKLTGGKFFKLNMEFFTTLVHAAGSYFMFFLQFTKNDPTP